MAGPCPFGVDSAPSGTSERARQQAKNNGEEPSSMCHHHRFPPHLVTQGAITMNTQTSTTAVLEHLDPTQLTIDANIRADVHLDPEFLASIKQHGVLQPVVAHRTEQGVHVLYGQRRTLAAVETARSTMPVYVVASLTEADRLVQQMVENDQRLALTDRDRTEAFHQMSLLGVSAAQIAKKTGAKKATVETALKVRANEKATKGLAQGWTLDQSAALMEFSDDDDAVTELNATLEDDPAQFEHKVAYLRRKRQGKQILAAATAEYEAKGVTVLKDAAPTMPEHQYTHRLNRADGTPATRDDATAVVIQLNYNDQVYVNEVVANWQENGYTLRHSYSTTGAQSGPLTDEQKEERRRVIKNNKLWDAATEVRQSFLISLLGRKTPPKGWAQFTATTLANYGNSVARATAQKHELAAGLAGVTEPDYRAYRALVEKPTTNPDKAVLAMMLAAHEADLSRESWRRPGPQAAYYLFQLEEWGYTLSEVESLITAHAMKDSKSAESAE